MKYQLYFSMSADQVLTKLSGFSRALLKDVPTNEYQYDLIVFPPVQHEIVSSRRMAKAIAEWRLKEPSGNKLLVVANELTHEAQVLAEEAAWQVFSFRDVFWHDQNYFEAMQGKQ